MDRQPTPVELIANTEWILIIRGDLIGEMHSCETTRRSLLMSASIWDPRREALARITTVEQMDSLQLKGTEDPL